MNETQDEMWSDLVVAERQHPQLTWHGMTRTWKAAWKEQAVRVEGSKKMLPSTRPCSRRSPPAG